jgi:hypothetical protein
LGDYLDFIRDLFNNRDDAIVNVTFGGEGFVFYLGSSLPGEGSVSETTVVFPTNVEINDLRFFLKRRIIDGE